MDRSGELRRLMKNGNLQEQQLSGKDKLRILRQQKEQQAVEAAKKHATVLSASTNHEVSAVAEVKTGQKRTKIVGLSSLTSSNVQGIKTSSETP